MTQEKSFLTPAEEELKERFDKEVANRRRLPSTAAAAAMPARFDQLLLPDDMRARLPITKDKYVVREDPYLVQWEREVRKFERRLSPDHGHRVSAAMVYEWATGLRVAEISAIPTAKLKPGQKNWKTDINRLNQILTWYFGKPYMTYICGRKVPKAYRIKPGYHIMRHRPMTLTLYVEWVEGVLEA